MDYFGIMEKKMETTGIIAVIWGYISGLYGDNGQKNGNYYNGLYRQGFRVWECRILEV